MIAVFLLSLALLGFWFGWTVHECRVFGFDEELWISRLFVPSLSFLLWLGFFVYALGGGWL